MRLIIFVKIPERVDPIPLDITDDRPSQAVLDDILILAKLSTKNDPLLNYYLSQNGTKLDLSLELSKNSVKNGTLLELIKINDQSTPIIKHKFNEVDLRQVSSEIDEEPKSSKKKQKKTEEQTVPGKKIDFD